MTTQQQLNISISKGAAEHVRAFAEQSGKTEARLRVGVKGGGCSGLTYMLDIVDKPQENDKAADKT